MPTLNWIGKEAVVKHHKEVPFRLIEPVEELSCSPPYEGGAAPASGDGVVLPSEASPPVVRKSSAFPGDVLNDRRGSAADLSSGIAAESSDTADGEAELRRTSSGTAAKSSDPKSSGTDGRSEGSSAYLGLYKDRAVFLLYNGILKDRSDIGGNVLNGRTLEYINGLVPRGFEGELVIYGARSRFDKTKLAKLGITFHQLPYDLATKTWFLTWKSKKQKARSSFIEAQTVI